MVVLVWTHLTRIPSRQFAVDRNLRLSGVCRFYGAWFLTLPALRLEAAEEARQADPLSPSLRGCAQQLRNDDANAK